MKTQYEYRYENLIFELIVRYDVPATDKAAYILDFHQNSHDYYEKLCDFLYMISVGRTDYSLWITKSGEPKLVPSGDSALGFFICSAFEVPSFKDDIIEQILFVFERVVGLIKELDNGSSKAAV